MRGLKHNCVCILVNSHANAQIAIGAASVGKAMKFFSIIILLIVSRPFTLHLSFQDLGLTRLDEILLLFIGVLACVLASVLWPKLKGQIDEWRESWASDKVQQQRRDARLHRISDVAKAISLGLDATLAHTQNLGASYDYSRGVASDFWTAEAAPFVGPSTHKDANA